MQIKEAFKLGFLARCVEEGLTPDQTHALAKSAADCVEKQALGASSALPVAAAALASVPAAGGLMAYLSNRATDADATYCPAYMRCARAYLALGEVAARLRAALTPS